MTATGSFTVKMSPQPLASGEDAGRARFTLDKHYEGPLTATAQGEMLSGGLPRSGSAGYVAIERV